MGFEAMAALPMLVVFLSVAFAANLRNDYSTDMWKNQDEGSLKRHTGLYLDESIRKLWGLGAMLRTARDDFKRSYDYGSDLDDSIRKLWGLGARDRTQKATRRVLKSLWS